MLGELYCPKGKALETAREVLEMKNPMACNIAYGCRNECEYCYIPYIKKGEMRFPKKPPVELVKEQFRNRLRPGGVFLSFMTDPFLKENEDNTMDLINFLLNRGIKVATLSKLNVCNRDTHLLRSGTTICSIVEIFSWLFEPKALPIKKRIDMLRNTNGTTWLSIEPYVPPEYFRKQEGINDEMYRHLKFEHKIEDLISEVDFADLLIFGKLNYDKIGNNKQFYRDTVRRFNREITIINHTKSNGELRSFIKQETLDFIR